MLVKSRFAAVVSLMALAAAGAGAQGRRNQMGQPPASSPESTTTTTTTTQPGAPAEHRPQPALPADSTTDGTVTVGGKAIAYSVTAGLITVGSSDSQDAQIGLDGRYLPDNTLDLPAKTEDQPATSRMFYTAYIAKGVDQHTRPVMFIYNGGPGSATMYLRMSSIGPVKVDIPDLQHPAGGPYQIHPNAYSLIDSADLIFIDAPGTGYSRVEGRNAFASFYGVDQDAAAFDRFIRRWLSKYNRWTSPRFLFGESYGTTRNAVLCAALQRSGVDLNGVIFLSQILNFNDSADSSDSSPGTENGYFLAFPSFAATSWYHHKVPNQPAQLEPWIHEVEQFSLGEYASALAQGADLDPAKKQAVAAKLESYTGVPARLWMKGDLGMTGSEFAKWLQDSADITTGRLDSRFEGPALNPLDAGVGYDPFTDSVDSAILAAMNEYAHGTLHFGENMTYKPSAREPGFRWDMNHGRGWGGSSGTLNVMDGLSYTMKVSPHMHVLLMGGYFDLGTLYFGAEYEMKHLGLPPEIQKNIDYKFFPTGHMVYVNPDALHGLHDRVAEFIHANEIAH